MSEAPFARKTVRWLVALCAISFLGALALLVFAPDVGRVPTIGPNGFSRSALGHAALVDLLRELDIPVVASCHDTAGRVKGDALLVVAEPEIGPPGSPTANAMRRMLDTASDAVLVLPKWDGWPAGDRADWVGDIRLRDVRQVADVLRAAGVRGTIRRTSPTTGERWDTRAIAYAPTFPTGSAQLLDTTDLEPLLAYPDGTLVGLAHRGDRRLLVLSDPDILANAGVHRGDNAELVVALVELLRPEGGAVVIDETLHGFVREPSVWRELFEFPLVLLMAQAGLVLLVLLWAGMGRFGAPRRSAPPMEPGHAFLIENTAELLRYRGHLDTVLPRYLESSVQDARRALGAPPELGARELHAWLDRVAAARGVETTVADLQADARRAVSGGMRASRVLTAARRIHRWREEIRHGPAGRT